MYFKVCWRATRVQEIVQGFIYVIFISTSTVRARFLSHKIGLRISLVAALCEALGIGVRIYTM